MFVRYFCTNCGQKFKSEEEHAGKQVNCAKCGTLLEIPRIEPIPAQPLTQETPQPALSPEQPQDTPVEQSATPAEPKLKLRMKKVETAPKAVVGPPAFSPPAPAVIPSPVAEADNVPPAPAYDAAAELAKYGSIIREPAALKMPKLEMPSISKPSEPLPLAPISCSASGTISTPLPPSVPVAVPIEDDAIFAEPTIRTNAHLRVSGSNKFILGLVAGLIAALIGGLIWSGIAVAAVMPLGAGAVIPGVLAGLVFSLVSREHSARVSLLAVLFAVCGIITGKIIIAETLPASAWSTKPKIDRIFYTPLLYDDMIEKGEIKDPFEQTTEDDKENLYSNKSLKAYENYQEQLKKIYEKLKNISPEEEKMLSQRYEKMQLSMTLAQELRKKGEISDPFAKVEQIKCPAGDRPPLEYLAAVRQANIESIKQQRLIRAKIKQLSPEEEQRLRGAAGGHSSAKQNNIDRFKTALSFWDILWVSLTLLCTFIAAASPWRKAKM